MLNIITSSKSYDPGFVLNWSSAVTLPLVSIEQGGDKFVSTIESSRKKIEKEVQKSVDAALQLANE